MRHLTNVLVLVISVAVSLCAAEGLSRVVFDPIDYLLPTLVTDQYLLHRVEPYSGGHDSWGFRNFKRPKTADIVCIGDSLTYGIAATARESWPYVLGQLRHTTVYNMGLGGYGPIQYLYLMRTKAVLLHPKTVIVGFYFGNDFLDVFNEVRFNKHWSSYSTTNMPAEKAPAFAFQPPRPKFLGGIRNWLARHSVLYAVLTRTRVLDFFRERQMKSRANNPKDIIAFSDSRHNTVFNLSPNARFLDLGDKRIRLGMEVTKEVFLKMRDVARRSGFRLIVALLPTKESVYRDILERHGFLRRHPALKSAVTQESEARAELKEFLSRAQIEHIDLLAPLRAAAKDRDPFPRTDGHPNALGYHAIAVSMNKFLDDSHQSGSGEISQGNENTSVNAK